jgi:hypothetical protein
MQRLEVLAVLTKRQPSAILDARALEREAGCLVTEGWPSGRWRRS